MVKCWCVLALAAALTITTGLSGATPGYAADPPRSPAKKKRLVKQEGEPAKREARKGRDSGSYTDPRADMADPSGDYKGYPDWARAALGPKFDY
jgi:hypothetical protein